MIAQASMFCTYTHEIDQFFSVRRTCDLDGSWAAWTEDMLYAISQFRLLHRLLG